MNRGIEFRAHGRDGVTQGADPVGESCGHRIAAEVEPRFGCTHHLDSEPAMCGHRLGEDAVEAIHLGLQRRTGVVRERRMGAEVVLVLAGVDGGEAVAVLRILLRLVGVHGDDADGADAAGAGDDDFVRRRCQRVGGGEGLVVGHGPDGLVMRSSADALGQFEHAAGLAARAIDVQHNAEHRRVRHRPVDLSPDLLVAGKPRCRLQPQCAAHQGPVDRDHGDVALSGDGRRSRRWYGRGALGFRPADARAQHGEDRIQLGAMNQQRRVEQPLGDVWQRVHGLLGPCEGLRAAAPWVRRGSESNTSPSSSARWLSAAISRSTSSAS